MKDLLVASDFTNIHAYFPFRRKYHVYYMINLELMMKTGLPGEKETAAENRGAYVQN